MSVPTPFAHGSDGSAIRSRSGRRVSTGCTPTERSPRCVTPSRKVCPSRPRSAARVLCLSVQGVAGIGDALTILEPDAVVLAGGHARDDEVARWAYGVRSHVGALPVTLFRREVLRPLRGRTTGARLLSPSPSVALSELMEIVEVGRLGPARRQDAAPKSPTPLMPRSAGA